MPPQKSNPSSPADAAPQNPPSVGQPPAVPPTDTNPAPPQSFSGIWFNEEYPQILIQWTLNPATPTPPSFLSPTPSPSPGSPTYTAQVGIYQLVFDTMVPSPLKGPVVPFSLSDPSVGLTPYLQGSLVLSPIAPNLEVVNLQFPGFKAQSLTLYPVPSTGPETGEPSTPAGPAGGGDSAAPGTSLSSTSQPAAEGDAAGESTVV